MFFSSLKGVVPQRLRRAVGRRPHLTHAHSGAQPSRSPLHRLLPERPTGRPWPSWAMPMTASSPWTGTPKIPPSQTSSGRSTQIASLSATLLNRTWWVPGAGRCHRARHTSGERSEVCRGRTRISPHSFGQLCWLCQVPPRCLGRPHNS